MPFDGADLSALNNAEILALAESRPGKLILISLEAIMISRIAARDEALRLAAKPARKPRRMASPETRRIHAAQKARKAGAKQQPTYMFAGEANGFIGANPLLDRRWKALTARHGEPAVHSGYAWFAAETIALSCVSAGVWDVAGNAWRLWSREDRFTLTMEAE